MFSLLVASALGGAVRVIPRALRYIDGALGTFIRPEQQPEQPTEQRFVVVVNMGVTATEWSELSKNGDFRHAVNRGEFLRSSGLEPINQQK